MKQNFFEIQHERIDVWIILCYKNRRENIKIDVTRFTV